MKLEYAKLRGYKDFELLKMKEIREFELLKMKVTRDIELLKIKENQIIDQKNRRFALLQLVIGTVLCIAFQVVVIQSAVLIRDGLLGKKSSNKIFTFSAVAMAQIAQAMEPVVKFTEWIFFRELF